MKDKNRTHRQIGQLTDCCSQSAMPVS